MGFLWARLRALSRGGVAGLIATLVVAGVVAFVLVARTINTTPQQCATCHPQLTAMWQRSQGHPAAEVTCYQCHAPHAELPATPNVAVFLRDQLIPEKYLSRAALLEARCLECHPGVPAAETEQKQIIRINHKVHLTPPPPGEGEPLDLGCLDCHRNLTHDRARVETNRPRMADCFVADCHRKDRNRDNCLRCHYQQLVDPDYVFVSPADG